MIFYCAIVLVVHVNYFDFELIDAISELERNISDIELFPNPINSDFQLNLSLETSAHATIKLFDMSGKFVQSFYNGDILQGSHSFNFQIDTSIKTGMYFIEIRDARKRYFEKVMIQSSH